MSQKGEPACLFKVITWYENRIWSHLQATYCKCSKYWILVSLKSMVSTVKRVSQFRISIIVIPDFKRKSMCLSLWATSKLCQVLHLMICVTLGGVLPSSSGIFSQNPVWCSDGNAAMRNPYPTKSPCVIWEAKRGFSLLGTVYDFLL